MVRGGRRAGGRALLEGGGAEIQCGWLRDPGASPGKSSPKRSRASSTTRIARSRAAFSRRCSRWSRSTSPPSSAPRRGDARSTACGRRSSPSKPFRSPSKPLRSGRLKHGTGSRAAQRAPRAPAGLLGAPSLYRHPLIASTRRWPMDAWWRPPGSATIPRRSHGPASPVTLRALRSLPRSLQRLSSIPRRRVRPPRPHRRPKRSRLEGFRLYTSATRRAEEGGREEPRGLRSGSLMPGGAIRAPWTGTSPCPIRRRARTDPAGPRCRGSGACPSSGRWGR